MLPVVHVTKVLLPELFEPGVNSLLQCLEDSQNKLNASVSRALLSIYFNYIIMHLGLILHNGFIKSLLQTLFSLLVNYSTMKSLEGIYNTHNVHVGAVAKPNRRRRRTAERRFSVNIWAGIAVNDFTEPYLLPFLLNGSNYFTFLDTICHTFFVSNSFLHRYILEMVPIR